MVVHPSAFVLFSDVRNRSDETPYYGNVPTTKWSWPLRIAYTTRFSSRHDKGGNITFSDGHAAFFKYSYVVSDGTASYLAAQRRAKPSPPATIPAAPTSTGIARAIP